MRNLIEFDCEQNRITLFTIVSDSTIEQTVINFLTDVERITVHNTASTTTTLLVNDGVATYVVDNELLKTQGQFSVYADNNSPIEFVIENDIAEDDLVSISQNGYIISVKSVSGGEVPGQISWDDISGKPQTFPPSAHIHEISQVQNLQDTLDDKANVDLSNISNEDFKTKAINAGVGGGAVSWDDVQNKPNTFPPSSHSHAISDVTGLDDELYSQGESISNINQTLTQFADMISDKMDVPTNTGSSNQWLKRSSGTQGTWASLPNASSSQAGLMSTNHYSKVNRIGNYVVGSGSWGDWYYKIYNDNWLECWINIDVTNEACTTSLGGGFYRTANLYSNRAHNYPWDFVDYPHIQAVYITTNNASGLVWFNPTSSYLKTNLPELYIVRPVSGSKLNGYISFHVCGKCNYG